MPEAKTCAVCGRVMEYRKAWARNWEDVRYCSDACRRRRKEVTDGTGSALEEAVLAQLAKQPVDRPVSLDELTLRLSKPRETVRQAARRLEAGNRVTWTQSGHSVDPSTAKGDVGLRLVPHPQ